MENQPKFEQALADLEQIVKQLERGETPLDESITLFEQGVKLSRVCSSLLKNAQQRVDILLQGENGMEAEAFTVEDEK